MKMKVGETFQAFNIVRERRERIIIDPSPNENYGALLLLTVDLAHMLEKCDAEIEISDHLYNLLAPFLSKEVMTNA